MVLDSWELEFDILVRMRVVGMRVVRMRVVRLRVVRGVRIMVRVIVILFRWFLCVLVWY